MQPWWAKETYFKNIKKLWCFLTFDRYCNSFIIKTAIFSKKKKRIVDFDFMLTLKFWHTVCLWQYDFSLFLFPFSVPECSLPFGDISHGAILCSTANVAGQQKQRCELFCDQGYVNTLLVASFLCDPQARNWLDDAPLSYACQSKGHTHIVLFTC